MTAPLVIASQMEADFNAGLAAHPLAPRVIAVPEDEPWEAAREADILLVRPSPAWRGHQHRARPAAWPGRLRWVYSASAGIDFYPPWLLDAPLVTCGRGVASDEIADYVIAAIYAHAKNLDAVTVHARADWRPAMLGRVGGSTIGIVGLGAIGGAVARRAIALGARVVAVRRGSGPAEVAGVALLDSVESVVAESDHIVIAVPATLATRGLFDARMFARAKPGAHLINVARGSVIDQEALVAALDSGRLDFATLDVTEPEPLPDGHALYTHPRVRLTPHVSSNYLLVRHRLSEKVADDLDRFARGEAPSDIVDPVRGY
ncbi:NAD(P)-dependent oxidoreductase [Sphingomonas sp. NFR15]|uniref:NAD(P)-dependent oxidoreductase n=1 Tax=Sphingomonas sp. NFR15 TaxID=1566282 RepID=UPI0008885FA6|nr:NAD(P)-dependent oxidoreductase [Sphingomonas sp. NFR15]SDA29666.1 Phosphoglycerate dehydrogenase [Sphingomonas sp. NFR15]